MRILIINPNSDPEMTASIQQTAEKYAAGQFEAVCRLVPEAPRFIETFEDQIRTGPGMIRLVRQFEADHDGFIIACHSDPHLDALREITGRPVVGIGEASMKLASMLGHRFSVLVTHAHSIPGKQELIRRYGLDPACASVRAVEPRAGDLESRYLRAARLAVETDGAEVIVLGCAGLTGLDRQLEQQLDIPVLDGVVSALIVVSGLVRYGVSHSKRRRWNVPAAHSI